MPRARAVTSWRSSVTRFSFALPYNPLVRIWPVHNPLPRTPITVDDDEQQRTANTMSLPQTQRDISENPKAGAVTDPINQQQKDADGRLAITLADAVFVVNNEKGHGGGRGSARGWT